MDFFVISPTFYRNYALATMLTTNTWLICVEYFYSGVNLKCKPYNGLGLFKLPRYSLAGAPESIGNVSPLASGGMSHTNLCR